MDEENIENTSQAEQIQEAIELVITEKVETPSLPEPEQTPVVLPSQNLEILSTAGTVRPELLPKSEKFTENMLNWKVHLGEALASKQKRKDENGLLILKVAEKHRGEITNLQVQQALHCSQITAYRYLKYLEKQGKLKRTGGHNVSRYEIIN